MADVNRKPRYPLYRIAGHFSSVATEVVGEEVLPRGPKKWPGIHGVTHESPADTDGEGGGEKAEKTPACAIRNSCELSPFRRRVKLKIHQKKFPGKI